MSGNDGREIERKFRLPALPDQQRLGAGVSVAQGYLPVDPAEMRIRQKGNRYYLTVKGEGDVDRAEWETEVPRWVFDQLWPQTATRQIYKTRFSVAHAGLVLEIDEYHGRLAGLFTLECEFPSLDAATTFVPPEWAHGAEEVSSDARFKNRCLAECGLPK